MSTRPSGPNRSGQRVRVNGALGLAAALSLAGWAVGCDDSSAPVDQNTGHAASQTTNREGSSALVRDALPAGTIPTFREISREAGVLFRRDDDFRGQHRIVEANGGGVALFDYDNDGRIDILLTSGCRLPLERSDQSATIGLFRNLGQGQFEEVTERAGLTRHAYLYGCAVGDFNSDGFDDLYLTAFGRNVFWRNNGDGTFSEITEQTGTECERWSSSTAFADFNLDGILDLYVTNYVQYSAENPRLCRDPDSPDGYTQCAPTIFDAEPDRLFLGDGQGGFHDVTVEAGITGADGKGLGVVVFDANGDRWPDIYVGNDGTPNFLYINETASAPATKGGREPPVPRFREQGMFYGAALNGDGKAEGSMGVACGDYDGDGRPDLYVSHFYAESNTLFRSGEASLFLDDTRGSGAGASTRPMVGWGTGFWDFDNDGWLDLFVANGHVDDFSWRPSGAEPYVMQSQLFRNERNGRFVEVSRWCGEYFRRKWLGRGAAVADLDDDGDLDLVVSHQREASAVLRNDTETSNHSVILQLVGRDGSNRAAIGARLEAELNGRLLVREVTGGGSYQSASDRRVHIGLGTDTVLASVRVQWPSGAGQELSNLAAGTYLVREGEKALSLGRQTP